MAAIRPITQNFTTLDTTGKLVKGVAPLARYEYLIALASRVSAACLTPYVGAGLCSDMTATVGGGTEGRTSFHRINIGATSVRGLFVKNDDPDADGTAADVSTYGITDSGVTSNDEILVDGSSGSEVFPVAGGYVVLKSSELVNATPTSAGNRLYEITASLAAPSMQTYSVENAQGFSAAPYLSHDLGTISTTVTELSYFVDMAAGDYGYADAALDGVEAAGTTDKATLIVKVFDDLTAGFYSYASTIGDSSGDRVAYLQSVSSTTKWGATLRRTDGSAARTDYSTIVPGGGTQAAAVSWGALVTRHGDGEDGAELDDSGDIAYTAGVGIGLADKLWIGASHLSAGGVAMKWIETVVLSRAATQTEIDTFSIPQNDAATVWGSACFATFNARDLYDDGGTMTCTNTGTGAPAATTPALFTNTVMADRQQI
ncbi:MAG: hypothetical protein ACI9MR_000005 [Myxococcota bacterium]|jgi:hypothetical protein